MGYGRVRYYMARRKIIEYGSPDYDLRKIRSMYKRGNLKIKVAQWYGKWLAGDAILMGLGTIWVNIFIHYDLSG